MDKLLAPDQVAEILQIPKATLFAWKATGSGPRVAKIGKHLRYRLCDVEAWVERQIAAQNA